MIKHLSYSSIGLWNSCPRMWYAQYILGLGYNESPALLFGKAAHAAIEGSWLDGKTPTELYRSKLLAEWNKTTTISHTAVDELTALGDALFSDPSVLAELAAVTPLGPEWVERKIEFAVPGVPVPVIGYIDTVCDDGVPLDIKTSRWDWDDDRAQAETQPWFYLHGLDLLGMHQHRGRFRHLVVVKDDIVPRAYMIECVHKDYTHKVTEMVRKAWEGMQSKAWERVTPEDHNPRCRCFDLLPESA